MDLQIGSVVRSVADGEALNPGKQRRTAACAGQNVMQMREMDVQQWGRRA